MYSLSNLNLKLQPKNHFYKIYAFIYIKLVFNNTTKVIKVGTCVFSIFKSEGVAVTGLILMFGPKTLVDKGPEVLLKLSHRIKHGTSKYQISSSFYISQSIGTGANHLPACFRDFGAISGHSGNFNSGKPKSPYILPHTGTRRPLGISFMNKNTRHHLKVLKIIGVHFC